ncbi:hypothetical protein ELI_12375 [Erythrobacter litoralis HTCC2594]|uniref:Uncharacterized protein n=2 Tax=Erythrobacter litoralis TaxID=39960 RepID=Q2N6X4_ERYLH|nr:hypothetical protein ELI_12375 [Erythrobacter litoralis HTCC2594]
MPVYPVDFPKKEIDMIGKMIGALVGGKLAQNARGIGGPTGAVIGAAVPMVLRRLSLPAMVAMGVGGYAVKKYMDRKEEPKTDTPATNVSELPKQPASVPQPTAA